MATWGNLANRMLSFAYKRFEGQVPEPGQLDGDDRTVLEKVEVGFETVGDLHNACKFRAALGEALALAREANGYLDRKAPWFQIKEDPRAAATTVYVILRWVDNLKTILSPILPHTAQQLHVYLGYDGQLFRTQQVVEYQKTQSHQALTYDPSGATGTWAPSGLPPGQALRAPAHCSGSWIGALSRRSTRVCKCPQMRTDMCPRAVFGCTSAESLDTSLAVEYNVLVAKGSQNESALFGQHLPVPGCVQFAGGAAACPARALLPSPASSRRCGWPAQLLS